MDRRSFLVASTVGFGGLSHVPSRSSAARPNKPAKSTILFFLCGGASHIDTWDMKPNAPLEYRGPFSSIQTTAPAIRLCEHLPRLAKQAHHLAVIHGITDAGKATGDHHAGYYYNLTGQVPDLTFRTQGNDRRPYADDWPFMGSVVGSQLPQHPSLPQVVTLPHKPSRPPYTRPGQFAARLGVEYDPLYLNADPKNQSRFMAPALVLDERLTRERMNNRRSLLTTIDDARRQFENDPNVDRMNRQHRKAFELLTSARTTGAFDMEKEPRSIRESYGNTINGMSLLMARRLVEAGVPFVTVFWREDQELAKKCRSAGGWDTHGNNFNCLKQNLLPEFDRGFAALISDLHQRNLLDDTLLLVSSEMGRKPKIGDPRSGGVNGAGRDHWTACMSVLMAGGGIRGGQVVGETDRRAEYPAHHPYSPADVAQSVFHCMGIDRDLQAADPQAETFNLSRDGSPISQLF